MPFWLAVLKIIYLPLAYEQQGKMYEYSPYGLALSKLNEKSDHKGREKYKAGHGT